LRIARTFPDISLIISGHSHTPLGPPLRERNSLIVRTGSFGKFVGQVDLDFEDRALQKISTQLIEAKGLPPDPEALRAVEPYRAKAENQMNTILGEATAAFPRIVWNSPRLQNQFES
jgi:2',3'-cyclic-nucleotide 2'-phosphodiesterase (5'-nucleotidase family)